MSEDKAVSFMNNVIVTDKSLLHDPSLVETIREAEKNVVFTPADVVSALDRYICSLSHTDGADLEKDSGLFYNYAMPVLMGIEALLKDTSDDAAVVKLMKVSGLVFNDFQNARRALCMNCWNKGIRHGAAIAKQARFLREELDVFLKGDDGADLEEVRSFFKYLTLYYSHAALSTIF